MERLIFLDSLRKGTSAGCRKCNGNAHRKPYPKWLYSRFVAARSRCQDPTNRAYGNYGARGIEFRFKNAAEAAQWMMDTHGLRKDLEVDREDNNGHYERGNLIWSSRREQCQNTRTCKIPKGFVYRAEEWPYSLPVVTRKLCHGMSREQIFEDAKRAVREKRKRWRLIAEKLESMTC
jgi:hypothetical protein